MRILAILSLFCLFFQTSWSQKTEKHQFKYSSTKVEKVIQDIEKKFNIRYSYVDSILTEKKISIPKNQFSINEINTYLENQTGLKIINIDSNYYSIIKSETIAKTYKLEEVLVDGFVATGINKIEQKLILKPDKIEALPGVTDTDLLLSLQQLPGVKSPNETATGLHIRGGTPDQNQLTWNGIRLYHSGHLFGMISGINPNIDQTVTYFNKATSPKYGEKVSSFIGIQTTDAISEKVKYTIGVNAINTDFCIQTPLVKKKFGLQLSARKSFTEWLQSPTFVQLAEKVFQNTNLNQFNTKNQFGFQDYSAKLIYKPNAKKLVSLSSILIDNHLNFTTENQEGTINNQSMNVLNYGLSLNWSQSYGPKFSHKILLFYSLYDFDYEKRQEYTSNKFEAFKKLNRIVDSGVELNFSSIINKKINLDYGYQILGNDASHLFNNYNQEFGIDLSTKQLYNLSHVAYVDFKYKPETWTLNLGMRYVKFGNINDQNIEPRIYIQNKISSTLFCHISYEKRSQILSQIKENFANDLSLENYVWVLSNNGGYPVIKSSQTSTGFIIKTKKWLLDVDAYYKTINGISSLTFGFQNQNDSNILKGLGFTKGVDILLQMATPNTRIWTTYTFQDSKNKFETINNDNYFQSNTNIKHAFNLSINQKYHNFHITTGWFIHSGKPFGLLNESGKIVSYNSENLPSYHHLDISCAYHFNNSKENKIKVGFSLYNAYNNHKIISKEFQRKYSTQDDFDNPKYTVENYYSLGITPNIFMRVIF
jgi:hypothetical protein